MGYYNFSKDLKRAKKVEALVGNFLEDSYKGKISNIEKAPDETFVDYDLKLIFKNKTEELIEIKEDQSIAKTRKYIR
jgi:Ribonuclease G/E